LPREVVVAEGLTKVFDGFKAVDEVSFRVVEGEVFGFLGPNGAGKTTTINMLITLMKPTKGEAWINGYSVLKEPDKVRRSIGVVFQDSTVDRELTGWENMWIHGVTYKVPRDVLKRKIVDLLGFVELDKYAKTQVRNYSGGMVRRLEIARALLHEPEVLFLDEPTLGLDPQTRAKIWEYILELKRRTGMTIFLTTHYMDEAERLCDRVAIIDHGKILVVGSPEELKRMIGRDVVYVKAFDERSAKMLIGEVARRGLALSYASPSSNVVSFTVEDAHSFIPEVFEVSSRLGVHILEVKYSKPTLNDVFLHLTGRELRDESGSWMDFMRARMRRGFRRG